METDHRVETAPSSLRAVMLASAGEPFDRLVINRLIDMAGSRRPVVHVLSIARIWGTALGLQHPGLYPTRREWKEQGDLVEAAVLALKRRGFDARGQVIGSRHAGKTIASRAAELGCDLIVMGARPLPAWRRWLGGDEVAAARRRAHTIAFEAVPIPQLVS